MNEGGRIVSLPRTIRRAAVACLLLSGTVGFWSANEALGLARLSELNEIRWPLISSSESAAFKRGLFRALGPMRTPRVLTLGALSIACTLSLVSAGRMLYPSGLSRERMRRLLVDSTLVAALLRTIDGAQGAVLAKKVALAVAKELPLTPASPESVQSRALMPSFAVALAMALTCVIVIAFTLLSQYFRSKRVQEALASVEPRRP